MASAQIVPHLKKQDKNCNLNKVNFSAVFRVAIKYSSGFVVNNAVEQLNLAAFNVDQH